MFTSDDDKQLVAQLNDGIELCLTRQKPYFMPFMSERKQAVLFSELKKAYFDISHCFPFNAQRHQSAEKITVGKFIAFTERKFNS